MNKYYDDAHVGIRPAGHGQYTIEATLYGINVSEHSTDSELYDMFRNEDTRDEAKRIALGEVLTVIEDKAFERYYRALYTINADPALCEDGQTALMLAEALWLNDQELTADDFDDDEEWASMLAKLDLEDMDVQVIHRTKIDGISALVCLAGDWDYKTTIQ